MNLAQANLPETHTRSLADTQPLRGPQEWPQIGRAAKVQCNLAENAAKVHQHLLTGGTAGRFCPIKTGRVPLQADREVVQAPEVEVFADAAADPPDGGDTADDGREECGRRQPLRRDQIAAKPKSKRGEEGDACARRRQNR